MLRAAHGQPADELDHVGYFLSYEIVTGRPYRAAVNERNTRTVSADGVARGRSSTRTVNAPSAHSPTDPSHPFTDPSHPFTEEVPPWRSTHCRPSSASRLGRPNPMRRSPSTR
ncbi:hypothetical protein ACTPOK_41730 [Streptomyces inhibens]|uniref:hypothetical protein n=1 Tax=Streptomyces inhibens TaxID=2293571 RepID=UPI00402AA40B